MAKVFLFRCPTTGLNVQGFSETEPPHGEDNHYEAIPCMACRRVHLVNVATGKLRSEEQDE